MVRVVRALTDGSAMISFPTSARIMVAAKPVDFRRGGESLAALAREVLKEDPFAGVIVIFRSRRASSFHYKAPCSGLGVVAPAMR